MIEPAFPLSPRRAACDRSSASASSPCCIVKRAGDRNLIEFRSVVDVVRCAIKVRNGLVERNAGLPPDRRIEFRISPAPS
jgi:hypothetical protein